MVPTTAPPGLACRLVRLDDRLRNAPAVTHLVPVLPRPDADRGCLLAVRTSGLLRRRLSLAATTARPTADLASVLDEGGHCLVELVGVLVGQVDLVRAVVQ